MANNQSCRIPPKPEGYKGQWKIFGVLSSSTTQRNSLWETRRSARDAHTGEALAECRTCRGYFTFPELHAEHIQPLHAVDRSEYPACLWFWSINNLEFCCVDCHKIKTKREVKANAKVKRIVARNTGTRRTRKAIPTRKFSTLPADLKAKIKLSRQAYTQSIKAKKSATSHRSCGDGTT